MDAFPSLFSIGSTRVSVFDLDCRKIIAATVSIWANATGIGKGYDYALYWGLSFVWRPHWYTPLIEKDVILQLLAHSRQFLLIALLRKEKEIIAQKRNHRLRNSFSFEPEGCKIRSSAIGLMTFVTNDRKIISTWFFYICFSFNCACGCYILHYIWNANLLFPLQLLYTLLQFLPLHVLSVIISCNFFAALFWHLFRDEGARRIRYRSSVFPESKFATILYSAMAKQFRSTKR